MNPEENVSVQHNTAEEHNDLGVSYYNAGRFEKALEELLIGASLSRNWRIHKNLAIALMGLGHYRDAQAVIENILRHQPDDAESQQLLDDAVKRSVEAPGLRAGVATATAVMPEETCNVCGERNNFRDTTPENVRESLWCNRCNSLNGDRMMIYALSKCLGYDGPLAGWGPNKAIKILETDGHRGHPTYLEQKFDYHNTYFKTDGVPKNFEKMEFADLENLPFTDEQFDCVITCDVFEHVRLLDKALMEVYRVLKKGGYFILQVPFSYGLEKTVTRVQPDGDNDAFLLPAQYHGDNSLVYRDYGRDFLTHLSLLGFTALYIEGEFPQYNVTNQNIIVCTKAETLDTENMFSERERQTLFIEKHDNLTGRVRSMIENLCKSGRDEFSETSLDYDKSKRHYYFDLGHVDRIAETLRRASPYLGSLDSVLDIGSIGDIPLILKKLFGVKNIFANSLDGGYVAYGEGRIKERGESDIEAEVDIAKCDIEKDVFPFEDGSLDAVTGFEVLEHLRTDPMFMMREVNRVLKDGGVFILTTPNINAYQNMVKSIRMDSPCLFSTYLAGGKGIGHCKEYSISELDKLFVNSGFSVQEISTFSPYWVDPEMFKGFEELKSMLIKNGWDEKLSGQVSFVVGIKIGRPKYRTYEPLYTATEEEPSARKSVDTSEKPEDLAEEPVSDGRHDEAIKAVEIAIGREPDNTGLWYKYAQLLQDADRFDESIVQLTKVTFLDPNHSDAHNDLGVLYFRKGQYDKAVDHLLKALPSDIGLKAHRNLCSIYLRLGLRDEALGICGAILKRSPGDEEALKTISQTKTLPTPNPVDNQSPQQEPAVSEEYERIPCPFCGSYSCEERYREYGDIVKCSVCSIVYERTRLTEKAMYDFYQKWPDINKDMRLPQTRQEVAESGLRMDYLLDELIEFIKPSGTFLDVGCGWGAFLDNARSRGFRPLGLELTQKCVDFANNELHIPVMNSQLVEAAIDPNSLAAVSMSHVLEHIPNPREALSKIHRILKPGGMFFGAVPNIESLRSEKLREKWPWLAPNVHLVYYSPGTLKTQLERAGFVVQRLYTKNRDGAFKEGSLSSMIRETWGLNSDEEVAEKARELEATGYGDEIRFFASKPAEDPASLGSRARSALDSAEPEREKILEAEALIMEGKLEAAEGILLDRIRIYPSNLDALNDLAVTKILQGKNEEAIVHLRKVISIDPENRTAKENIRLILEKLGQALESVRSGGSPVPTNGSKRTIAQAEELMLAKRYDEAEELLAGILIGSPSNLDALNDLAVLHSLKGDLEDSIALFSKVVQIDPANTVARKNLGRLFLQAGRVEEALKSYAAVLEQAPRDIETISIVAEICRYNGRDSDAIFFYRRLLELDPNNERAIAQVRGAVEDETIQQLTRQVPVRVTKKGNSSSVAFSAEDSRRLNADGVLCLNPFYFFEVDITGEVVVCCTAWLKRRLGNIKYQTIAEIWNGEPMKDLRRRMYRGEWEGWCSADCPRIVEYRLNKKLIPFDGLESNGMLTPRLVSEIRSQKDSLESTPTLFKLSDSKTCNLSCIMCSVKQDIRLKDDPIMLEKRSRDMYQYLDSAKTVLMSGNGDPLARADTRTLLMNYDGHNPELKFSLVTNALLLPRYWDRIKHQRFDFIDISVDASRKETYEKIRVGGKWEELLGSLSLVKANQGKFESVILSMVVMRSNYREIPSFIDFAESYGFYAMFSRIHGMFGDENIFELNDAAALDELRQIVSEESSKQRSVQVLWQDLMEFSNQTVIV